jgi:hypothetical protein
MSSVVSEHRIERRTSLVQRSVPQLPPPIPNSTKAVRVLILLIITRLASLSAKGLVFTRPPPRHSSSQSPRPGRQPRKQVQARKSCSVERPCCGPSNFKLQNSFVCTTDYAMPAHARQNPLEEWVDCQCSVTLKPRSSTVYKGISSPNGWLQLSRRPCPTVRIPIETASCATTANVHSIGNFTSCKKCHQHRHGWAMVDFLRKY